MDINMKALLTKLLTKSKNLYVEVGKALIIDDPRDKVDEAYNDGIRSALLVGYLEGAADTVLGDTDSLIEHVIAFNALLSRLEEIDYHYDR